MHTVQYTSLFHACTKRERDLNNNDVIPLKWSCTSNSDTPLVLPLPPSFDDFVPFPPILSVFSVDSQRSVQAGLPWSPHSLSPPSDVYEPTVFPSFSSSVVLDQLSLSNITQTQNKHKQQYGELSLIQALSCVRYVRHSIREWPLAVQLTFLLCSCSCSNCFRADCNSSSEAFSDLA